MIFFFRISSKVLSILLLSVAKLFGRKKNSTFFFSEIFFIFKLSEETIILFTNFNLLTKSIVCEINGLFTIF